MLEAIGAEEVHHEQIGGVAVQHVRGDVGHHVVAEKALRELRPLAQAVERKAERPELAPDIRMRRALEDALILEERKVEVETGSPAGAMEASRPSRPPVPTIRRRDTRYVSAYGARPSWLISSMCPSRSRVDGVSAASTASGVTMYARPPSSPHPSRPPQG